jgi:hypothetical protein
MKPLVYLNHNRENQKSSAISWVFAPCKSVPILSFVLLLSLASLVTLPTSTTSPMTLASISPSSASHEAFAQTEGDNTSTLSYTDPSSGITFQYPSSWEIRDVAPSLQPPDTISATRLVPPGQNATGFIDNAIVLANNVSNTTLGQYTEGALAQYNNVSGIITITASEPTTLAGNPAHMIEYLENHPDQQLKKLQVWTVVGDRVYTVTFAADESEYPQYLADVQTIIESLQISNGAEVQQQQLQPGEQESLAPFFFKS